VQKRAGEIVALERLGPDERSRGHFFWTYQQVLDRYGCPDWIHVSQESGLLWTYRAGDHQYVFTFHDGFVVNVWSDVPSSTE
jgi:hypothetical protein